MFVSSFLATAFAAVAAARKCRDISVMVPLTSRNAHFDLEPLTTDIDTTDFFLGLSKQGTNYTDILLDGYHTVKGVYKLATTYCEPDSGPGHTLQILTHGIGFDRSYWDLPFNHHNYSYVATAVDDHGYSTLSWDRLGVGASSHGETVDEIQVFLELAALKALTEKAAAGKLCMKQKHKYDSIAHVGHSFGSAMTYNFANLYPELTKGIILQGFSQAPGFLNYFAVGGNFVPVSSISSLKHKYEPGYIGVESKVGTHINFFGPGNFDPKILDYAYKNQQAFTAGEILSVGAGLGNVNGFTGPVMIVTGDNDVPFCGGNCMGTAAIGDSAANLIAFSGQFFPKASPFNATIIPGTGHGLNMEYSHTQTYSAMLDFFDSKL